MTDDESDDEDESTDMFGTPATRSSSGSEEETAGMMINNWIFFIKCTSVNWIYQFVNAIIPQQCADNLAGNSSSKRSSEKRSSNDSTFDMATGTTSMHDTSIEQSRKQRDQYEGIVTQLFISWSNDPWYLLGTFTNTLQLVFNINCVCMSFCRAYDYFQPHWDDSVR